MAARSARRDSSGALNPLLARLRRYQAVLQPLGLWDAFVAMPKIMQGFFVRMKFPDPALEFDASVPADQTHRALRREVEWRFHHSVIEFNGKPLLAKELFTTVEGLLLTIQAVRTAPKSMAAVTRFVDQAAPVLEKFYQDRAPDAAKVMQSAILGPVCANCKLERRWFGVTLARTEAAKGRIATRAVISAVVPQMREVTLDGVKRRMYRAMIADETPGVHPISCKAPGQAHAPALPVYVQAHALRQLQARVNHPEVAPYAQAWMAESLAEPRFISPLRDGDWLVEYRVKEHRVGYLVVTPMRELMVVRTFLFLTMRDTPEGRKLERKLDVSRAEIEHARLDELLTFTHTDLRSDAKLVAVLTRCGCAHLFDLGDVTPQPKPMAEQVRKFLRIAA